VHVNLFVGADNIRDLDGLETVIAPGLELSIIPAISGG
jgi:molybdopterin converting factor small subunit